MWCSKIRTVEKKFCTSNIIKGKMALYKYKIRLVVSNKVFSIFVSILLTE